MHVLILNTGKMLGGAEAYLNKVLPKLITKGVRVTVINFALPTFDTWRAQLIDTGVAFVDWPVDIDLEKQDFFSLLAQRKAFRRILRRVRPDLVLINSAWYTHALGIGTSTGQTFLRKAICCIRLVHLLPPHPKKLRFWSRSIIDRKQRFTTVSSHAARGLEQAFILPEKTVHVIHNGVAIPPVPAHLEQIRSMLRTQLGLPDNAHLLLTPARLDPQKGHHVLLEALAHIIPRYEHVYALWAGSGSEEQSLRTAIAAKGLESRIFMLGYQEDISPLLWGADAMILPSFFEGMPFAALEAAAYRLPLIASAIPAFTELFSHGVMALLAEPGNAAALAVQIETQLNDPEKTAARKAAAYIRVHDFSLEKMQDRLSFLLQGN